MRIRFPLWLKKRGRRRTGSPATARLGGALYHSLFILAGSVGAWWLLTDVLLPEARLAHEAESFEQTECRVVDTRVGIRPGLAEEEYCPELLVEFTPLDREPLRVWTRHGVGRDTPSRDEAEASRARYEPGETRECWYDPNNPERVLLSVHRRWWPWLVLSIPVSLIAAGTFGMVRSLVSSQSSPERRSYLWRGGLEVAGIDEGHTATGAANLGRQDDSPGVKLRHRLPLDSAEGWRVVGMAALCVLWNALAALFVYQLAEDYLSVGGRIGLAALIVAPLAATGAWMTRSLWRDASGVGAGGATRIEIANHPIRLGTPCPAMLLQSGPTRIRSLGVWLVCEEIVTYRQGTDTRTAVAETHRSPLLRERRLEVAPGEPYERSFLIDLPPGAAPSFASPHNEVRWSIEAVGGPPADPEWRRRFPLWVAPPEHAVAAAADPQEALA